MTTTRLYNGTNISANTGVINTILDQGAPYPSPGVSENIINMRMRMKTNVVGVGQYLSTVSWFDGGNDQVWQFSLNTTLDNYAELPMQIWWDHNKPVTVQVDQLSPGGSVDVRLISDDG